MNKLLACSKKNIESYIQYLLTERYIRLQPHRLVKEVHNSFPDSRPTEIKAAIKDMMAEGLLNYTNVFSSTFIIWHQKSDLKVSASLQRYVETSGLDQNTNEIPILLSDGVAFGNGEHPTTRLCIRGIDMVMQRLCKGDPHHHPTVLDIGTGTGVLAIAAALLGAGKVFAIDTDPVACREAIINIDLNLVSKKVFVLAGNVTTLRNYGFDLVLANLRVPTLKRVFGHIEVLISGGGVAILSGFRPTESDAIEALAPAPQWRKIWFSSNRGWAAMAIERQTR